MPIIKRISSVKKIKNKNYSKNIKSKKLIFKQKKFQQKGGDEDKDFKGDLVDRFSFFNNNGIKELLEIYEKNSQRNVSNVITKSGKVLDEDELFSKKYELLEKDEQEFVNEIEKNKFTNISMFLVSFHGSYNYDYNMITIPKNTYICFMSYLNHSFTYLNDFSNTNSFYSKFSDMNPKMFKDIVKNRAGLSSNTKGSIDIIDDLPYIDCFENSTWYYPGQSVFNLYFSFSFNDVNKDIYEIDNNIVKYQLKDDRIVNSSDDDIKFLKEFMLFDDEYEKTYNTQLSEVLVDINLKNDEKYKIIIINSCRPFLSSFYENVRSKVDIVEELHIFYFKYEAIVHFINLRISKKKKEQDNNSCYLECAYTNNNEYKFRQLELNDVSNTFMDKMPDFSRLTPHFRNVFNTIKEKLFSKLDKQESEIITIIEKISDDLFYISLGSMNMILDFFVKILNELVLKDVTDIEKKIFIFEYLVLFFIIKGSEILLKKISINLQSVDLLFSHYYHRAPNEDFIKFMKSYFNLHCFFYYVLKKHKSNPLFDKLSFDTNSRFLIKPWSKESIFCKFYKPFANNSLMNNLFDISLTNFEDLNKAKSEYEERKSSYQIISSQPYSQGLDDLIKYLVLKDYSHLEEIELSFLDINNIEQNNIGKLFPEIKNLTLSHCNINLEFHNLQNLTILKLDYITFKSDDLTSLISLKEIEINSCKIEKSILTIHNIEKVNISNIIYLKELNLTFNQQSLNPLINIEGLFSVENLNIKTNTHTVLKIKDTTIEYLNLNRGKYSLYFDNIVIDKEFDYFYDYHLTDKKVFFFDIKKSSFKKDIQFYNVFRKDFEHLDRHNGHFKLIDCSFDETINLNDENINIEDLIITQATKGFYYGCYIQIFNIQNVIFEITKEEFTLLKKIPTMDIEIRPIIF